MALKEYIGLTRLTEVFGYLKTKLDAKVDKNGTDRLITSSEATKLDNINKVTVIDSSTDLNDCTDINLLYSISGSAVPVHAPTNYSYNAAIWNKTYGDYAVQFYWTNDVAKLYYRRNNNGSWGGWRTIAVTSDIPTDASDLNYDNTTSGLSATDIQAAIDEIAQGGGSTYTEGDGIDISAQNVISVDTTFTEASTRANIDSGDTFSTILGKIKKFFTDLKTVAFSGSYNDLSDKPTIPAAQVNSDWNASSGVAQILNKPSLATVATSGSYNDLSNKPTIPTNTNQLTNGAGFITSSGSCNYATSAGSAAPTANSVNYVRVYNSNNVGQSGTVTVNDLAKQHFAAAMISAATDNPRGSSGWVHVLSQAWSNGSDAWCAQWAISVQDGVGAYYRSSSGSGSIAGRGWNRIIDSNNIGSQSVNYAASAGAVAWGNVSGKPTFDTAASKNTVAMRDGNGYLRCVYLNASNGSENIASYSGPLVAFFSTDGWLRKTSQANFKSWLGSFPASDVYSWAKASSKPSYAWSEITSKPTFSTSATANAVAQRDGSGHLTMVDCKCAAVVVTSNNWLPICGYGAVTIRNRDNSAYIPAFASAFTVNSSRRYKENIVGMTEEDAKALLSLRPVTFDYKEGVIDGDRTGQKGLIAEEVAEIETFPVVYNQDGEVEGLDYSKFVPQLIMLCQMQQKEIDELKVRLDILERTIVTMTHS